MKPKNEILLNYLRYGGEIPDDVTILNHWNFLFSGYSGVKTHKSLDSKVLKITNVVTGESYWKTLKPIINEVFVAGYKVQQVIDSINNYHKIITSEGYYYNKKWSLAEFLYKGVVEKKGFVYFLSENKPLDRFKKSDYISPEVEKMESLGKAFKPVAKTYDPKAVYDLDRKTYFGFSLNDLKNVKLRRRDLDYYISHNSELSLAYFRELELIIASLLLNRKKNTELSSFVKYMVLWNKEKERFK